MAEFIDLHIHSTYSDGSNTPKELVSMACEKGLYAIALTDHDTVAGVPDLLEAAKDTPLNVIPGVEISSVFEGKEVHILGYNVDHTNEWLTIVLNQIASMRYERNSKMCELLNKQGIDITMAKLYARFNSRVITRSNFAIYMVEKGYCKSKAEVFEKYLANGAPCYIPRFKLSMSDAHNIIEYAGGICSIAHPVKYRLSDKEYMKLFKYAKSIGINGIEAMYSTNTAADESKFKAMAKELGMFITGGSDYHGFLKPDISIGTGTGNLMVPKTILNDMWNIH